MGILINKNYNWTQFEAGGLGYWFIGSEKATEAISNQFKNNPDIPLREIRGILDKTKGNYAIIIQTEHRIIAAVDKIRSYPIFYSNDEKGFQISNSARTLKDELDLNELDNLSVLEFSMAGYVTGRETLYKHLYQIQAGEFIVWERTKDELHRERYYVFSSKDTRQEDEDDLIEELDEITDNIFKELITELNGAPVWVPLSGGLDSRLVLCKLKQLKYNNLITFSYGPPGNYEAKVAKYVAEKIGIPWQFFPLSVLKSRKFFSSELRSQYWEYSDGLSSVPNMQDIHVLHKLMKDKIIPRTSVIINGQSGDFITGGHIPHSFLTHSPNLSNLFENIIKNHYSQWSDLKSENILKVLEERIAELLEIENNIKLDAQTLTSLFEQWEWQERQCKYVINGQRIYDFFGFKWFLPLWDDEYLRFWEKIPFELKYSQKLYKHYLDRFNFFGCFKGYQPQVWRWPGMTIVLLPAGQVIKHLFGAKYSEIFYNYFRYIGHYRQYYAHHSLKCFLKNALFIRGPVSLYIKTWLKENNQDIQFEEIGKAM